MCRGREVLAHLRDLQAQTGQRQMHNFCRRHRQVLPPKIILGAIRHEELRAQFRTSSQLTHTCSGRIQ